jgi:hypothetical protein
MAKPEPESGTKPRMKLALSAESQEKARAAAERLGYGPDALQKKIQEMMADSPEMRKKKNEEHAAKMGIDPTAVIKRWTQEARSPFLEVTRSRRCSSEPYEVSSPDTEVLMNGSGSAIESIMTPEDILLDTSSPDALMEDTATPEEKGVVIAQTAGAEQSNASTKSSPAKRKRSASRKLKMKNELSITNQNLPRISKKSVSKSASPATNVAAESSRAGASRETAMDYTPSLFVSQSDKYTILDFPQWHLDIGPSSLAMKELAKKRPQELTALEALKDCIGRCEEKMTQFKSAERRKLIDELRNHVHKAEFLRNITKFIVRKARILVPENGLPRIFRDDVSFPPDLKADAYQLYLRWVRGEFSQDILRGITTIHGKDRTSDRLDKAYRARYPSTARFYGDEGLVLGQCWPTQLCTVRDGAHGSSQGGIFGEKDKGAYSIVLSGGGYHDKDDGDTIEYCGTEGKNFTPTKATQHMTTSARLSNPIRVIRSHQLHQNNKYRPEHGLRYDGLYTIKSYEIVDNEKQIHRFKLERCPGQESIRCADDASKRPTIYEVSAYRQVKA